MSTPLAVSSVVVALLGLSLADTPVAWPQSRDMRQQPLEATAAIRGRVIAVDRSTPLRGAEVRAVTSDGNSRLTMTDPNGSFELRDLPPGSWVVTASKAGFVSQQFGQRRPTERVRPIELTNGQAVTANFALMRGGAIEGHVFDEFGEPVAGARVELMRARMVRGIRQLESTGANDQTDDRGAFRLYGLAPGDHYVSAIMGTTPTESPTDRVSGPATYFPGTTSIAEAQRITLGAGEEQSINFPLAAVRGTVRLSGTLIDSTGVPASGATVNLLSTSDWRVVGAPFGNFGLTRENGVFTMLNVAPGSYVLAAGVHRQNDLPEEAWTPITVGLEDVAGINVVATKPAMVVGRIVGEDGSAPPQTGSLRVLAQSTRGADQTAGVAKDGTFRLQGTLGQWSFTVEGLPDGWMVNSIHVNGKDVTDVLTEFTGAEREATSRIVITPRSTEVSGSATLRDQPAPDVSIVVFPEDSTKWAYPSRYVRFTRTGTDGHFSIQALPPDRHYRIAAVEYVDEGELQDPEFLERLRDVGISFSLEPGARERVAYPTVREAMDIGRGR